MSAILSALDGIELCLISFFSSDVIIGLVTFCVFSGIVLLVKKTFRGF